MKLGVIVFNCPENLNAGHNCLIFPFWFWGEYNCEYDMFWTGFWEIHPITYYPITINLTLKLMHK